MDRDLKWVSNLLLNGQENKKEQYPLSKINKKERKKRRKKKEKERKR